MATEIPLCRRAYKIQGAAFEVHIAILSCILCFSLLKNQEMTSNFEKEVEVITQKNTTMGIVPIAIGIVGQGQKRRP